MMKWSIGLCMFSIIDWLIADISCPAGQVFKLCGTACNSTCSNIAMDPNCEDSCVEGCFCPDGLTLNSKDQCVPVQECPCQFDGKEVEAGKSFSKSNEIWYVLVDLNPLN